MDDIGGTLSVLVCDDDPADRKLVKRCLEHTNPVGLRVFEAGEPAEIEAALKGPRVDIVLMDLQMPGRSGLQWLQEITSRKLAPVIMLTGYGSEEVAVTSLQHGAAGYISKNALRPEKLADTIAGATATWKREQISNSGTVHSAIDGKSPSHTLSDIALETVKALAMMAEMRDPYTAGHQRRVAELARAIAKEMKLSPDQILAVQLAGMIHDIGKVRVPAEILTNPGKLTDAEFTIIKAHPQAGFDIVRRIELPWQISRIIHEHHERLDGSGYPSALCRDDIAIESSILAVADVVEAMASHRPYRPALGLDNALLEISGNRKNQYDSTVVEACLSVFKDGQFKL